MYVRHTVQPFTMRRPSGLGVFCSWACPVAPEDGTGVFLSGSKQNQQKNSVISEIRAKNIPLHPRLPSQLRERVSYLMMDVPCIPLVSNGSAMSADALSASIRVHLRLIISRSILSNQKEVSKSFMKSNIFPLTLLSPDDNLASR